MRVLSLLLVVVVALGAPLRAERAAEGAEAARLYRLRHGETDPNTLDPVILFPGLGGSGLQAEIDKDYAPAWNCFKEWSWWGIWLNLYEAFAQTCWFDNLYVNYDPSTDKYYDNRGVKIRPNDFGGLDGVNKLDHFDDPLDLTGYFLPIIKAMEAIGYKAGTTLFGAPYDWRIAVDYLYETDIVGTNQTFMQDVIDLIEHAYTVSGNRPVHLVTHSMGGPTVLYLLNRQPLEWKTKYIRSFVPIAGPWAGALKALKAMLSGDNLGLEIPILEWSILKEKDIAHVMRSSGGASYLIPDYDYYGDQVFVQNLALGKNYSAGEFGQMWMDVGATNTSALWSKTKDLISDMSHPQVNSYCLYGYGVPTEIGLTFDKPWPTDPREVVQPVAIDMSSLGDGTVPLFSLVECQNWLNKENTTHAVNCKEYNLIDHTSILKDVQVHLDLLEIVTNKSPIHGCSPKETPQLENAKKEMEQRRKR